MSSVTVAGTVPWQGVLELAPPNRTVRALRAHHAIEIYVELSAGTGYPGGTRPTSLHLGSIGPARFGEGRVAIPGLAYQAGSFVAPREYSVSVLVLFGRLHPSTEQRAEAHDELMRLILPRWPRPNAADG